MSKEKIANLCAECERYIGTQGGGMDQAIAFLATEGEWQTYNLFCIPFVMLRNVFCFLTFFGLL